MKVLITSILMFLLLIGCSAEAKEKPEDVDDLIWNEVMQYSIYINQQIENESNVNPDIMYSFDRFLSEYEDKDNLTNKERDIISAFDDLQSESIGLSLTILNNNTMDLEKYNEIFKELVEIYGEGNLQAEKLDELFIASKMDTQQARIDVRIESYKEGRNVQLDADDVRYDMVNNLGITFYISGTAEISDYYNYGFTNTEVYFSVEITPEGGSYSDSWHLYFFRGGSNEELYNELLNRETVEIIALGLIPETHYRDNQGNLALGNEPLILD